MAPHKQALFGFAPTRRRSTRRRGMQKELGLVVVALGGLFALVILLQALRDHPAPFILLVALGVWVFLLWRNNVLKRRAVVRVRVERMIEPHLKALRRRKLQLVTSDAYGKPQIERWDKEVEYFISNHIGPLLSPSELAILQKGGTRIDDLVHNHVAMADTREPVFPTFSDDMSPSEFEAFCAEELRGNGWEARVTLQSRDQGVDVIAEKDRVRIVLQCKLYSSPVGNRAVQEAAAARAHEQADFGIVVSNQRYTEPAEQLATTNGILLLHYRDLKDLFSLLHRTQKA